MANELICVYPTGNTLYTHVFDATGQIWNGSAFEAPASGNWANYDIAMSEAAAATQIYRGTMPGAGAGAYSFVVRKQAGGSPAVADIAVAVGDLEWDGSAELPLSDTNTDVETILADTGELQTDWTDGGRLDLIIDAILADTNELQTDDVPGLIAALNDPTAAVVADAVWDEDATGHQGQGSFGQAIGDPGADADTIWALLNTNLDQVLSTTESNIRGSDSDDLKNISDEIAALNNVSTAQVNAEADQALADYDGPTHTELISEIDDVQTDIAALNDPTAASVADAVWNELSAGHVDAGKAGAQLWTDIDAILLDTGTTLDGKLDTIDGNVDAVLVDTGTTLPATLTTIEGKVDTVDTNVDAVLVDTGTDGVVIVDGAITAAKLATDTITAAKIAANAITSSELATSAAQKIADEVLKRGADNVEDTASTLSLTQLLLTVFESAIVDELWTIRKTDGTTFTTKTVIKEPGAVPITGVT